ncbi:hypothetical protein Ddye_017491 [Dipteronia dyeriana]|uniref:Uncharacterized protein n=1 Tax=Dipteronia dyeriana TaxID=168575 RepID=A0AAD9U8U7_9ROSI|nr:hypothetical protein Ddye_017491 [Dipteronia dyeriana]
MSLFVNYLCCVLYKSKSYIASLMNWPSFCGFRWMYVALFTNLNSVVQGSILNLLLLLFLNSSIIELNNDDFPYIYIFYPVNVTNISCRFELRTTTSSAKKRLVIKSVVMI